MDKLELVEAILDIKKPEKTESSDWGKQILILERGWVVVGDVEQKGAYLHVTNGAVIRRWGTTGGLGELAVKGPLAETKLDAIPELRVHQLRLVASIKWEAKKWK